MGAAGGAEAITLTAAELPAHSHPITDKSHTHTVPYNVNTAAGSNANQIGGTGLTTTTNSAFTGITTTDNNTGGGSAHANIPPAVIVPWIIRVI